MRYYSLADGLTGNGCPYGIGEQVTIQYETKGSGSDTYVEGGLALLSMSNQCFPLNQLLLPAYRIFATQIRLVKAANGQASMDPLSLANICVCTDRKLCVV